MLMNSLNNAFATGFMMQIALISSLGMQNLYLIDRGIKKEYPFIAAAVCFICELALMGLGLWSATKLSPELQNILTIVSSVFLIGYGAINIFKGFKGKSKARKSSSVSSPTLMNVSLTAVGFSLLNPQAVVESLIFYGGLSQNFSGFIGEFVSGALLATFIWLMGLAGLTKFAIPHPPSSRIMARLNVGSGIVLIFLGVGAASYI